MVTALVALAIISCLELLIWTQPIWKWRKPIACILLVSQAVACGLLFSSGYELWRILIVVLSFYQIINLLRLVEGRAQSEYLYHATRRTLLTLLGMQLIIASVAILYYYSDSSGHDWWYVVVCIQIGFGLMLLASTFRHLRTTRPPIITESYADRDLPTLTVAIPARNESEDMAACLRSIVANNYPKLEILVLDDCSQEKRTPEILRSFAHDGVRFIAGKVPPERWLAKIYAYKQLTEASSGDLILFCGVDVRFDSNSLRAMVISLLQKKKSMLSFIPQNKKPQSWHIESILTQPSRYAWEMSLPRRLLNRPPVLSTCWLIERKLLKKAGGLDAVNHSISPESFFARAAISHNDSYGFMQSTSEIGLMCEKSLSEQRATAVRTRYPQLHRRPELAGLMSLAELGVLLAPFFIVIGSIIANQWNLALLSLLNCLLLITFYTAIVKLTYRRFLLRGIWGLPLAALYDIALLNYSMWQYEFKEVVWKDRNVCIPVMHVLPTLPK